MKSKNISDYRVEIDDIDKQLLSLLEKRMNISKEIGLIKSINSEPVINLDREKQLLEDLKSDKLSEKFIQDLFSVIIKKSVRIQNEIIKSSK